MVENTGKTLRTGPLKPVNQPEPLKVVANISGHPVALWTGRRQLVQVVEDRWRIDDEWWRHETVSRMYYSVRLVSGLKLVIFKDLIGGEWYRQ